MSSLIPTKNPKALWAYYCGIFSLIPGVGFLLGPMGILFGILGLRTAMKHPSSKGSGHAAAGLVFGLLGILISVGVTWYFINEGLLKALDNSSAKPIGK